MANSVAFLLNFFGATPTAIQVVLLTLLPVTEFRLAIPVALTRFHFSLPATFLLVLFGALCIFFPLYFSLMTARRLVGRFFPLLLRPFDYVLERAQKRLEKKYERYGALALCLFIALPLPFTGVWTATLAAVALKIPFRAAFFGTLAGIILGQFVVMLLTVAAVSLF